jgi:hypothetical protein
MDKHTVAWSEPEILRHAAPHDASELRFIVLEREIAVSRRMTLKIRDLALYPDIGERVLQQCSDIPRKFAYAQY